MYVDKAQCKLPAFATTRLVDIGYIVEYLDVLHYLLILVDRELIGLGIEPQRKVAHGLAAKRVAFTRADNRFGQLLLFVRFAVLVCCVPLFLFLGIEVTVCLLELRKSVNVEARLGTCRRVRETEAFVAVVWLVNLIEFLFRLVAHSLFDNTLAHEDWIVLGRILDSNLAVLNVGNPFDGVPVQCINVSLGNLRAKNLKFCVCKFLVEFEGACTVFFVCTSFTLTNLRTVHRAVKFIAYVELCCQLQYRLIEA